MSLDYSYIFSQIDKAKKKKKVKNPVNPKTGRRADGSVPWNSPLSRKILAEDEAKRKKEEEEIERTGGRVSQRRYRRNPGKKNKPSLHRGTLGPDGTRTVTGQAFRDEDPYVAGPKAYRNVRPAASSSKLTNAEREEKKRQKKDRRKLTPEQIAEKKRRGTVGIGDLNADGKISDKERELLRQKPRKPFDTEAKERKAREEKKRKETEAKVTEGTRSIATGLPTVRTFEHGEAEEEEKRRERQRKRGGKKPGIDPEYKKVKPKKDKKTEPKKPIGPKIYRLDEADDEETDTDPDVEVDVKYDDDSDVGPIGKSLWKSWLENKVDMATMKRPKTWRQREEKEQEKKLKDEEKKRQGTFVPGKRVPGKTQTSGVKVKPKEGESWKKFKERQDEVEDPREHKTLEERISAYQEQALQRVEAQNTADINAAKPSSNTSAPKPEDDDDDWENPMAAQKALWKSWLEKMVVKPEDCPFCKQNKIKDPKERWRAQEDWDAVGQQQRAWHDADPDDWHAKTTMPNKKQIAEIKRRLEEKELKEFQDSNKGSHSIKLPMSDNLRKLVHHHEEERIRREKQEKKLRGSMATDLKDELKAEEGMGGMNMGAQRGLGHDAGYIQSPGQSVQITEVKDKKEKKKGDDATEWHKKSPDKCTDCGTKGKKGNTVEPTYVGGDMYWGPPDRDKPGELKDLIPLCENCALRRLHPDMFYDEKEYSKDTREETKSAYENHEQDESPETKPNKQQIPASKPGTDVFKSLYKKALIIKYKNIYKPLNT